MAIEKTPKINQEELMKALLAKPNEQITAMVEQINNSFEYWDTVKYKKCPKDCSVHQLWVYAKAARLKTTIQVWEKYGITLTLTNSMQRMCHEFDMNWGGSWGTSSIIEDKNKEQYLVDSLMEEAIYSSQMEGAATTRKVAKENDPKGQVTTNDFKQLPNYSVYRTTQGYSSFARTTSPNTSIDDREHNAKC